MPIDHNRFLMEQDKLRREINREVMNPAFSTLGRSELEPLLRVVANARLGYIKQLMEVARSGNGNIDAAQIAELRRCRETFQELVEGANALETIIERGYLDVESI